MSRPWVEVEESASALDMGAAAHLVPVSDLRQTFFDDLDASSRVNLKRRLQVVATDDTTALYDMQQAMGGGTRAANASRGSSQPSARPTATLEGRSSAAEDHLPFFDEVSAKTNAVQATLGLVKAVTARGGLAESGGEEEAVPCALPWTARATQRKARLLARNGLVGVLTGMATKRVARKFVSFVASGLLITKLLCMTGYAEVRWHDLLHDSLIYPLRRCCAADGAAHWQEKLLHIERSIEESMGSFWLAGAFVAGIASGFLLS